MTNPRDMPVMTYPASAIPFPPDEKWAAYGWDDNGSSCFYGSRGKGGHAEAFAHARALRDGTAKDIDYTGEARVYQHYDVVRLAYTISVTPTVFDVEPGCGCGTTAPCTIDADVG